MSNIIPLRKESIKGNGHGLLEIVFDFALGGKEFVEDGNKDG